MALQKTIGTGFGVDADYWRIQHLEIHHDQSGDPVVVATVLGYADQTRRDGGSNPMDVLKFRLTLSGEPSRADVYTAVKALTAFDRGDGTVIDWSTATDV